MIIGLLNCAMERSLMDERERRTSEAYTALIAIADDKEIRLTRWERGFVRDLLQYGGPLSLRQIEIVQEVSGTRQRVVLEEPVQHAVVQFDVPDAGSRPTLERSPESCCPGGILMDAEQHPSVLSITGRRHIRGH